MEGIAAAQARIGAIEARISALRPQRLGAPATSFATMLEGAIERPDVATPAARLAPGGYGRLEAPAELLRYGNGQVPSDALVTIGDGGHRLHAPAARAFAQLRAAADAAGVTIGVTDSYRSLSAQQEVAKEKGLYRNGGLAAVPGTSPHGWGLALDLDLDPKAQQWMRANGPRFGFVEDTPREPWHWTYRPQSS